MKSLEFFFFFDKCMIIAFPSIFEIYYIGIQTTSREETRRDIHHFCLGSSQTRIYYLAIFSMSIHVSIDDQNAVFGNVSNKGI